MHDDHAGLHSILLQLGASSAGEIELRETAVHDLSRPIYRAIRGARWTYVDRTLAIRLRGNGAVWAGDVRRDPCPVA